MVRKGYIKRHMPRWVATEKATTRIRIKILVVLSAKGNMVFL